MWSLHVSEKAKIWEVRFELAGDREWLHGQKATELEIKIKSKGSNGMNDVFKVTSG